VLLAFALAASALVAPSVRAESNDRLDLSLFLSRNVERFHSIGADTLGLSYGRSLSGGLDMDFRVLDLPAGRGAARPSLHVSGGVRTDQRILGPAIAGMDVAVYPVLDFGAGIALEVPADVLLKGNAGVGIRLGWDGGYLLTRTGGNNFLTRSKGRFDFVRTTGGLAGTSIGIGKGRDDTFGWDAASNRWDVKLSIQGRLVSAPHGAPPAKLALKPGAKPSPPVAVVDAGRMMWLFADIDIDTDGGPFADGLRARAGLALDLGGFFTGAFSPAP
jgi:hypothetical protein